MRLALTVFGLALVGSANMDVRSFRLNSEVTALIYNEAVALDLARFVDDNLQRARRIEMQELQTRALVNRLREGFCRLLSPLL